MGRPSALDDRTKAEIGRRLAIGGDGNSLSELAREFKVGKATISRWFSKRIETVQNLAHTLAATEKAIEKLPVSERCSIRQLADQLKGIQSDLLLSAQAGARTSAIMAGLAQRQAERLQQRADEEGVVEPEEMRPMVAMIEAGNRASNVGVTLLSAHKAQADASSTLEDLVTGAK